MNQTSADVKPVGAMVVSFDFEIAWGMRSHSGDDPRLNGLERVGEVIESLLAIFVKHGISATWATVGHLMLRGEDCPGGRFPYDLPAPNHAWFKGGWYEGIPAFGSDRAARYYAPHLVEAICNCPVYQELASHTFSHANIGARDCTAEVARAELALCQQLAAHWGRKLTSLVFPRNLIGHLPVVRETGYSCFRAANSEWYWFGRPASIYGNRWLRMPVWVLRYLDEKLCLCPPLRPARRREELWEIPHSMFFPGMRGVSRWVTPEQRWRRAARGLRRAAERGRLFSLFTHPHNFLPEPGPLLRAFDRICEEGARLREQGSFEILTMGQVADQLEAGRNQHWLAAG